MRTKRVNWLFLLAASGAFAGALGASGGCSDDNANPGPGPGPGPGTDGSVPDQYTPPDATPPRDAGSACSLPEDTDPSPKVRLVNVLLATNQGLPIGQLDAPAIRLYANGAVIPNLDPAAPGKGAPSVTKYAKITAGDVTFSAKDDGASDASAAVDIRTHPVAVAPGARLTIFAIGRAGSSEGSPSLVIAEEKFDRPRCGEVKLRFLNADYGATIDSFAIGSGDDSSAALKLGESSNEKGVTAPAAAKSILLTTADPGVVGPTKRAPFTVPASVLGGGGRSYFVVSVGEPARWADDERTHALLLVPAGDDTPATLVKRDPLAYIFHASPPPTPGLLEVQSGKDIAANLKYGAKSTYLDVAPGGATLKFVDPAGTPVDGGADGGDAGTSGAGAAVLDNQSTGPLEPGGIYVGAIMGFSGSTGAEQLRSKFWKVRATPGFISSTAPRSIVIHASPNAPAVDVGYWNTKSDGKRGDDFTPKFTNIAYGETSDLAGTVFAIPQNGTLLQRWVGVQPTGDQASNRANVATGNPLDVNVAILMGDWNDKDPKRNAQLAFIPLSASGTIRRFQLPKP
ncbi:DUF4397 domain-containing protein [Pendulispora albinea]|uniref:DUF4397 domain-containing protein n=1 Tax=Pendulispora albinea TaxID=2741071 RepID=A0ABZ2LNA7_9BACT